MDGDVSGQCWRSLLRSHHRLLQKVVALGEQATVLGEIRSCYCSIINVQRMQIIRIYGWWMGGFKGLDYAISLKVEWFGAHKAKVLNSSDGAPRGQWLCAEWASNCD